ncbi:MAG: hypothetical protein P1P88_00700 [Bacteroidales bacterium]|nr:hypothetical protein [Bacteroidales bacterium]
MREDEYKKLESRIYGFSVNVFSFVKTLINQNQSDQHTKGLLSGSNQLYALFLDVIDSQEDRVTEILSKCVQICSNCSTFLENIKVEKKLLNEKVDLTIEANELGRQLNKYLK